jgi:murein L,D-transpeptidase YcbB/YkuD
MPDRGRRRDEIVNWVVMLAFLVGMYWYSRRLAGAGQTVARTGSFDDATTAAVKAFQSSKSIIDSGVVDKATLSALDAVFADLPSGAT